MLEGNISQRGRYHYVSELTWTLS